MFEIEKNVPIPNAAIESGSVYPFEKMSVGDSSLIPSSFASTNAVRASVNYFARKTGFKFCTRTEDDGVRVWRIA